MSNESEDERLDAILSALRDKEVSVRENAIQGLQRCSNSVCDDREFEGLSDAEIMQTLDERRTQWLRQSRIVEALLLAIDDSSVRVRSTTALMLGNIADLRAQEALIRHLRDDPSTHARRLCAASLGWTPDSARKVEGFIDPLRDPDWGVALCACGSLGRSGDKRAVAPLRITLSSPAWKVRFSACEALVKLGVVDHAVVELLERLNRSPEAKEHNKTALSVNEMGAQFASDNGDRDPQAGTTGRVLAQARRLLSQR